MDRALALVLESEKGLHLLYRHTLEKAGFQVTIVRSDDAFLQIVQVHRPDLIFFDLAPATKTRMATFEQLKTMRLHAQIVLTSTQPEHGRDLPSGYMFFLKPLRPDTIKKLAKRVMQQRIMQEWNSPTDGLFETTHSSIG